MRPSDLFVVGSAWGRGTYCVLDQSRLLEFGFLIAHCYALIGCGPRRGMHKCTHGSVMGGDGKLKTESQN